MDILTLALLLLAAVLISSVIDQVVPKVSLPLIQIALGVLIALLASGSVNIDLDPEIFLVIFIAPILYDEAKTADKRSLWHEIRPIISLAVGLVIVTALAIGFTVHWIIPSIPLAAAFALGAALGPTDAVTVASLSSEINIPDRQKNLLKGEYLINDASGIVSFQFALAAATTGAFSLLDATFEFFVEFFGGLLFGAVLGIALSWIGRKVRDIGIENTTFHVLLDLFTPLIIYLVSDTCHVSGIIAVVTAGLIHVVQPHLIGPSISRMNIVSSSVWRTLTFALNGIVFVLLGTQLPGAMRDTWDDVTISNWLLILYILLITAILLGLRFVWVLVMDAYRAKHSEKRPFTKTDAKLSLVTALSGAKGTVTLSILFTIPIFRSYTPLMYFPQRDLIIFLACGVILCTLLISNFVIPLLVPRQKDKQSTIDEKNHEVAVSMEIIRMVVEDLTAHQTAENRRETQEVIRSYNARLERIKERNDIEDEPSVELRLRVLEWEREKCLQMLTANEVTSRAADQYLERLDRVKRLLKRNEEGLSSARSIITRIVGSLRRGAQTIYRELYDIDSANTTEQIRRIQLATTEVAIDRLRLEVAASRVPTEIASELLVEYQRLRQSMLQQSPSMTRVLGREGANINEVRRFGLNRELEHIQEMYEEGELSRNAATHMRNNVYLMRMDLEDQI